MRILVGICGLGRGHFYSQLPLLTRLRTAGHELVVCAHDESLQAAERHGFEAIATRLVWLPGGTEGLDLEQAADVAHEHARHNLGVLADLAHREPFDAVLSNYEPVVAQHAYIHDLPLITLHHQAKLLAGTWPTLAGDTGLDEQQRLRLLFPAARARLAASFVPIRGAAVLPPLLRPLPQPRPDGVHVAYLSTQASPATQDAVLAALATTGKEWVVLGRAGDSGSARVHCAGHRDDALELVARAEALVCSAGHGMISEALALQVPVLAIPNHTYEQRLNAHLLEQRGLGRCDLAQLDEVLTKGDDFRARIRAQAEWFAGAEPAWHDALAAAVGRPLW